MLKTAMALILVVVACVGGAFYLSDMNVAVLNPKGSIAGEQRELIILATLLMLIVVLPVFALTAYIAWRYREGNKSARFDPDWDHSRGLELLWWAVPMVIIGILSVITWQSTHALDPFKPLVSEKTPLQVQVVATQWQWLFIYPEQKAVVANQLYLPVDVPVEFSITSDAPMNSFWIPNLGGQIYAMPGMATKLHLIADETGRYFGQSANISGQGFADMKFDVLVQEELDFYSWAAATGQTGLPLDWDSYESFAKPTENGAIYSYSLGDDLLFNQIIGKYTSAGFSQQEQRIMETHHE